MLLMRGTIKALQRSRRNHEFVLSRLQQQRIGATAIAASMMGMGAAAVGLIGMAGDAEEEADWVEFELNGTLMHGWLWMMPMDTGDNVEVVAEPMANGRYVVYAIKRDSDGLLAVYPHATAGRAVHYRKSAKIWMWSYGLAYLFLPFALVMQRGFGALLKENMQTALLLTFPFGALFFGIIAYRVSRKFMGFVRIAEMVFSTFGWPDIRNIDLRKISRENPGDNKLGEFGSLYFRYR